MQPAQSDPRGATLTAIALVGVAAAFFLCVKGSVMAEPQILLRAVIVAGFGWSARARAVVVLGGVALAALVMKDLWPAPWPVIGGWAQTVGLPNAFRGYAVRNPNLVSAAGVLGSLAAAVLGMAGLVSVCERRAGTTRLLLVVLAGSLVVTSLGILGVIYPHRPYTADTVLATVRSKNEAATLCALSAVLCGGLGVRAVRSGNRILMIGSLVGFLLAVYLLPALMSWTGVAGLGAGMIGLVLFAPASRRSLGSRLAWASSSVFGILLVIFLLSPRLSERSRDLPRDYRLQIWADSASLLKGRLLGGSGLGSFGREYPLVGNLELSIGTKLVHPDSSWVLVGIEWGVLAAAVLGAFIVYLMGPWGSADDPQGESGEEAWDVAVAKAGLLAWSVCGVSDIALHRSPTALVGLSLAAIVISNKGLPVVGGKASVLGSVGVFLLGGVALATSGRGAQSDSSVDQTLERLRWDPLNPAMHLNAASGLLDAPGGLARALPHLKAAVTLDHKSPDLAAKIAARVMREDPSQAAYFWEAALTESKGDSSGYGMGILTEGIARWGSKVPMTYWLEIVRRSDPGLAVVMAGYPGIDRDAVLSEWLDRDRTEDLRRQSCHQALFRSLEGALPCPEVRAKLARASSDWDYRIRYAAFLHARHDDESAWSILSSMPTYSRLIATEGEGRPPAAIAVARSLASATARVAFLKGHLKADSESRLVELEIARAYAEDRRLAEACDAALAAVRGGGTWN